MTHLWLVMSFGAIVPLSWALYVLPRGRCETSSANMLIASTLLCTLAFNLTFFWQELWLVLAKAMTPGLHPILYHNNHDWTGRSSITELLQGVGALATLSLGLFFLALLVRSAVKSGTGRLFCFWMAFEGLFQSLSQVAIGAVLPGNDVGRAFAYLGLRGIAHAVILIAAFGAMAALGAVLARHYPRSNVRNGVPDRGWVADLAVPATATVLLLIPFRLPRDMVEVFLVPAIVQCLGLAWMAFGFVVTDREPRFRKSFEPGVAAPLAALLITFAFFHLLLARGVQF